MILETIYNFINSRVSQPSDEVSPHKVEHNIGLKHSYVTIYNHVVKRVLFENGSASDVLYYDGMKKLGISDDKLKSFPTALIGFENEEVKVRGFITLPLTLVKEPKTTTSMVDFMVVKVPSTYNVLLG